MRAVAPPGRGECQALLHVARRRGGHGVFRTANSTAVHEWNTSSIFRANRWGPWFHQTVFLCRQSHAFWCCFGARNGPRCAVLMEFLAASIVDGNKPRSSPQSTVTVAPGFTKL